MGNFRFIKECFSLLWIDYIFFVFFSGNVIKSSHCCVVHRQLETLTMSNFTRQHFSCHSLAVHRSSLCCLSVSVCGKPREIFDLNDFHIEWLKANLRTRFQLHTDFPENCNFQERSLLKITIWRWSTRGADVQVYKVGNWKQLLLAFVSLKF